MEDSRAQAVILRGQFRQWCLPSTLYHGTDSLAAKAILQDGLGYDEALRKSTLAMPGTCYLTTSLYMAASFSSSRARHPGQEPVILAIDTSMLEPDWIGFDLNMSGGRYWSESFNYSAHIPPGAITPLTMGTTSIPEELMLLRDPAPGARPLGFDLCWDQAENFMQALLIQGNGLHP